MATHKTHIKLCQELLRQILESGELISGCISSKCIPLTEYIRNALSETYSSYYNNICREISLFIDGINNFGIDDPYITGHDTACKARTHNGIFDLIIKSLFNPLTYRIIVIEGLGDLTKALAYWYYISEKWGLVGILAALNHCVIDYIAELLSIGITDSYEICDKLCGAKRKVIGQIIINGTRYDVTLDYFTPEINYVIKMLEEDPMVKEKVKDSCIREFILVHGKSPSQIAKDVCIESNKAIKKLMYKSGIGYVYDYICPHKYFRKYLSYAMKQVRKWCEEKRSN